MILIIYLVTINRGFLEVLGVMGRQGCNRGTLPLLQAKKALGALGRIAVTYTSCLATTRNATK